MLVMDAYASWCECRIRAGMAHSVSRMMPPNDAVNMPHAMATTGSPAAALKPLLVPMTQNPAMASASSQFIVSSSTLPAPFAAHHRSSAGHRKNAATDAMSEMYKYSGSCECQDATSV